MNHELQRKFERHLLDIGITNDVSIFNKDHNGVYLNIEVVWMYRIWVSQEAKLETLRNQIMEIFIQSNKETKIEILPIIKKIMEDIK